MQNKDKFLLFLDTNKETIKYFLLYSIFYAIINQKLITVVYLVEFHVMDSSQPVSSGCDSSWSQLRYFRTLNAQFASKIILGAITQSN